MPSYDYVFYFQLSISYSHTIGTRVRISLMRSVSRRQKDKDPQAVCSVSSFTPRPMLRVGGGKDKGTRFLSFVHSMLGFRHLLKQEDLDKAASMCQGLKGHLRSRFLVLSDDRQPPPAPTKKRPHPDPTEMTGPSPNMKRFQTSNFAWCSRFTKGCANGCRTEECRIKGSERIQGSEGDRSHRRA